jgi:hypothetical protein
VMGSIRKYDSSLSWCEFILTEIKIKNKRVASPLSPFISIWINAKYYAWNTTV